MWTRNIRDQDTVGLAGLVLQVISHKGTLWRGPGTSEIKILGPGLQKASHRKVHQTVEGSPQFLLFLPCLCI